MTDMYDPAHPGEINREPEKSAQGRASQWRQWREGGRGDG